MQVCGVVDDMVDYWVYEVIELGFGYWFYVLSGQVDGQVGDGGFVQWGVEDVV